MDRMTDTTPTTSEMRAPYISADRMSRPWSSVPSRYLELPCALQAGGRRASLSSSVLRLNGSCGATQPANTEQKMQTSAMAAATIATGEVRKLWPTSLSSQRARVFFIGRECSPCYQGRAKRNPCQPTACVGAGFAGPQLLSPEGRGRYAKRKGNRGCLIFLIVIHLKNMKLSASWTSSTFLLVPQASDCWCSGRWPMSAL
jgi:hypothetical protein